MLNWNRAKDQKSNRNAAWVVVPLQKEEGQQVAHVWSASGSVPKQDDDQRGLASYTYQAFFKDERGQIQTYIFKVLPSVGNLKQYKGKLKLNQFDGIVLGFDEEGQFIEGIKYNKGRLTGATTNLSDTKLVKGASNGRLASCLTYSVSVSWRICVEYQGQNVCASGTDTYLSTFCSNTTNPVMADAPPSEPEGGGDNNSGMDAETLEILSNMVVLGPGKPIYNVRDYLRCFDNNANDRYKLTVYVDQPVANSNSFFNANAIDGHKVGHTYLGLTQEGPSNSYVNRVLGWYPAQGGSPFNPEGPGVLGQDDEYTGGYDVSVTFSVTSGQFFNVLQYISDHAPGNYNLNNYNCMDFGLQALQAANINLPGNYTQWPMGGGSNPGQLGQDLRNMTLPTGSQRQTSFGQPARNSSGCN